MVSVKDKSAMLRKLARSGRIGPTVAVDIEYYCRTCKGHYSRAITLESFWHATCRCGSHDLLVYSVAGELSAPLRAE
jgi:hypothetical protein